MSADFYARALWRIRLFTVLVGLTGSMVLLVAQGVRPAAGFLAGAALSVLNFRGLAMLVNAIGGTARPGPLAAVLIALRYVLIGLIIYVIVRFLGVTPAAVIWGLLAAFAAVILEILCELIFRIHG
jgi:hypothetical protein